MEAKDIVQVIKACEKSGVESITFGDVTIKFKQLEKVNSESPISWVSPVVYQEPTKQEPEKDFMENEMLGFSDPLAWEEAEIAKLDRVGVN